MDISESIRLYYALKLHFNNEKYDYFKYNGKVNLKMIPKNTESYFHILTNRYNKNLEQFYVSNFLKNPTIWLDDLVSQEAYDTYQKYLSLHGSLIYLFKNDIDYLISKYDKNVIIVTEGFPLLLKETLHSKIHLETLLLMNSVLKFFYYWDRKIMDEFVWKPFRMKCIKYYPFLSFDKDKIKSILKNKLFNY